MGGDFGPSVTCPALAQLLAQFPDLNLMLFGRQQAFDQYASLFTPFASRIESVVCEDEVMMDDKPSHALRHKQLSSMYRSVQAVAEGKAQACVSAGNTGALMAISRLVIKTLPGIDRPPVCSQMPTETGSCLALDLGANVDCTPEQLRQFAIMGSVMAKIIYQKPNPRVALLNVGEEQSKGCELVQQAALLLAAQPELNFIGFAEGDDIYQGKADVVVCDGFVGNAVLKASEGVARLVRMRIKQSFAESFLLKIIAILARPALQQMFQRIDPSRYNGAAFLGLQGVVVVSHGKTDVTGFANAVKLAYEQVKLDLPNKIQQQLYDPSVASRHLP